MSTRAANTLTARWTATLDDEATVLSGAGVHPLLALLARYADGPARAKLSAVVGDPTDVDLTDSPSTRMALGFWSRRGLPLSERWRTEVPAALRGELTGDETVDQAALDAWAAAQTDGRITAMPVRASSGTAMVLASALSVLTTWKQPFHSTPCRPTDGPWAGRDLAGLRRRGRDLHALRVVDTVAGPVSLLTVEGAEDVDVVLGLGPAGHGPAEVLPAAIGALDGEVPALPLTAGPGVTEQIVDASDATPELTVSTVAFTVDAAHDLLRQPGLFGLTTATDATGDHFPGITERLYVAQAVQNATATFNATGFSAAVVTAFAMRAGAMRPPVTVRKRLVSLTVDRPFGFVAVHRPTNLVLVAGWVTHPTAA
ncbi:serpin family protein [Micromonospora sp. NPDC002389]|uniref:serpin family protein n=1 Tax=Micromonospora sp. NPDC002389 TaxID=3154272 RepID=UPI00331E58A2